MKDIIKILTISIFITLLCQIMLLNFAHNYMLLVNHIVAIIGFIILTKDIMKDNKKDKIIKYTFYAILIVVSFNCMASIFAFLVYYIAGIILVILDKQGIIRNKKRFIIITIILFIIFGLLDNFFANKIHTYDKSYITVYTTSYMIGIITFITIIARQIKIKQIKKVPFIIITTMIILCILIFNMIRFFEVNHIIKEEEKIITIIENDISRTKTKKQIKKVIEKIFQENLTTYDDNGNFFIITGYKNMHSTVIQLLSSHNEIVLTSKTHVEHTKKEIQKLGNMIGQVKELGQEIRKLIFLSTTLNIFCIAEILYIASRKSKENLI